MRRNTQNLLALLLSLRELADAGDARGMASAVFDSNVPPDQVPDELADILLSAKPLEVLTGDNLDAFERLRGIIANLENVDTFAFVALTKAENMSCECGQPHPEGLAAVQVGMAGSMAAAEFLFKMLRRKFAAPDLLNMSDVFATAVDAVPATDPMRGPVEPGTEAPAADVNDKGGSLH